MRAPVVIAVPTRNRAHLLAETLDTLLAQDYDNFRVVVSDNASTDHTGEVVRGYAARDPRVTYSRNETNIGLIGNFNRAIELTAGGEYAVIAGDDDLYDRTFLPRLVAILEANPAAALAACAVDVIDESGAFVSTVDQKYATRPLGNVEARAKEMLNHGYGNLMTGVYRRSLLAGTGWFRNPHRDYWDWIDVTMLFDVAISGEVLWTPDVLLHKRKGGVSAQPVRRSAADTLRTIAGISRDLRRRSARIADPAIRRRVNAEIRRKTLQLLWGFRSAVIVGLVPAALRRKVRGAAR